MKQEATGFSPVVVHLNSFFIEEKFPNKSLRRALDGYKKNKRQINMTMWYPYVKRKANKAINDPSGFARLAGAGLSQIVDEMLNRPFAIMSAHLGPGQTPEERALNNTRQKNLKEYLHSIGKGWVDMHGAWNYRDENMPEYPVREHSLFIPNISKEEATDIGRIFGQEGIITGDKGKYAVVSPASGEPFLQKDDISPIAGEILDDIRVNPDPKEMADYSILKGKRFLFDPPPNAVIAGDNRDWIPTFYVCYAQGKSPGEAFTDAREGVMFAKASKPQLPPNVQDVDVLVTWWQERSKKPIRTGEK